MASSSMSLFSFIFPLIVFYISPSIGAKEIEVGSYSGWRLPPSNDPEMYTKWASSKRFHVGDHLSFKYNNDSVEVVDKVGYYHCNSTHPISVFHDGRTIIVLDQPGPAYFVSGDEEKCKNGERLMVEVMPKKHDTFPPEQSHSLSAGCLRSLPEFTIMVLFLLLP